MIRVYGTPTAPVPRLMRALEARGLPIDDRPAGSLEIPPPDDFVVIGPGVDPASIARLLPPRRSGIAPRRALVLSWIGTHPDARPELLRRSWMREEAVRGTGHDVLTLRLAPLVGPRSPLWLKLREPARLPGGGRMLFNPVLERDAIETLERAFTGRAGWEGWYDVAGRESMTLAELAERARAAAGDSAEPGEWEPSADLIAAQRLCDPEPWIRHFGIEPGTIPARASEWAA